MTGRITVGLLEDGTDATLTIGNTSGVVVGGVPGSGKTAGMMVIVLALYLSGCVRLHIIDGKGGDDWTWAKPAATDLVRDDLDLVHDLLLRLDDEMKSRMSSMRPRYGASNFWNITPDRRPPLEVVIIDECQTYFDLKGVLGGKEAKAKAGEILAAATDIVKKGRSAGFLLFAITQKPTVDSLPSALRDNCENRICFRVKTPEAARAVLGDQPEGSPSPTDIPPARRGGAIIGLDSGQVTQCRFAYVSEDDAEDALQNRIVPVD
ncbi:FtsK/SpoIIIE domain-containing protein [Bifidobacterium olomucense]